MKALQYGGIAMPFLFIIIFVLLRVRKLNLFCACIFDETIFNFISERKQRIRFNEML